MVSIYEGLEDWVMTPYLSTLKCFAETLCAYNSTIPEDEARQAPFFLP